MSKSRTLGDLLRLREQIESEVDRNYEELDKVHKKIWPKPKVKNNWELCQQHFSIAVLDTDPFDKCLVVLNFSYTDFKGAMHLSYYEDVYSGPDDERLWQRVHRDNSKLSDQGTLEQLAWLEDWKKHVNLNPSKEHLVHKHFQLTKRIRQIRQRGWPVYGTIHRIVKQVKESSNVPKDCEYYRVYLGEGIVGCLIKDQLHFEDAGADIRVPADTRLPPDKYLQNDLRLKRDRRHADLQRDKLHSI